MHVNSHLRLDSQNVQQRFESTFDALSGEKIITFLSFKVQLLANLASPIGVPIFLQVL